MAAENVRGAVSDPAVHGASMRPRRMAAENAAGPAYAPRAGGCFNEAAANGRGKHTPCAAPPPRRGRRFNEAAANGRGKLCKKRPAHRARRGFNEAAANGRGKHAQRLMELLVGGAASMRPRRMAAENRSGVQFPPPPPNASMRPRRMAAENVQVQAQVRAGQEASMRPRRMAAENTRHTRLPGLPSCCFNEAAANGRGKLRRAGRRRSPLPHASMRPRRMAAENQPQLDLPADPAAASMRPRRMAAENIGAIPGGTYDISASMRPRRMAAENAPGGGVERTVRPCFNEAAANGRGKHMTAARSRPCMAASMRPRRMAAENSAPRAGRARETGTLQ